MHLLDRFAACILHAATRAAKARNSGSTTGRYVVPDSMLAKPRPQVDADTVPLPACEVQSRYVARTNAGRFDSRRRSTRQAVGL